MYKKNASSNRDALFGGMGGGGDDGNKKNNKKKSSSSKPAGNSGSGSGSGGATSTKPSVASAQGYKPRSIGIVAEDDSATTTKKKKAIPKCLLGPDAKAAKLKEAEEYKTKANAAMQKSFFARPDPVAASTYYKRAADCYQALCDLQMEKLYRLESAKCNWHTKAWASAAGDYGRAAELALLQDEPQDAAKYHRAASDSWTQLDEKAKAAKCLVDAAKAVNACQPGTMLSKEALQGMEEAVEAHVPDPLNPFARYRQTGTSAFAPEGDPHADMSTASAEIVELAEQHLVSRSYAHEPLLELVNEFANYGEYASALYAAGAARVLLEKDGISTLSLSRVYVVETVLMLAMGDPIAAEQVFLNKHCQATKYLSTRECKLAEDLFRAVKMRDADALEEARDPNGSNRSGLANLHPAVRDVVTQLRIAGVARKQLAGGDNEPPPPPSKKKGSSVSASSGGGTEKKGKKKKKKSCSSGKQNLSSDDEGQPPQQQAKDSLQDVLNMKTGYEQEAKEGETLDGDALASELDGLDFDLGDGAGSDEDLDDDDFDLR